MSDGPRSNEFIRWGSMKRMNSLLRGSPAFNRTRYKPTRAPILDQAASEPYGLAFGERESDKPEHAED